MQKLLNNIKSIQDKATRDALITIAEELQRIRSTPIAKDNMKSLCIVLNKITGKIK